MKSLLKCPNCGNKLIVKGIGQTALSIIQGGYLFCPKCK